MNIAFFSAATYDSANGGRTRRLADELARRHQVHFIDMPSLLRSAVCGKKSLPGGIIRYKIPPMPLPWRFFDTAVGKFWVSRVVRFLERQLPPDTCAIVSTPFWAPVLHKLKIGSITYDCPGHVSLQSFGAPDAVVERLENKLAMNVRQIVCVGKKLAVLWKNRTAKPVYVISNGFPADFRTRPIRVPDAPTVGFCGAMYEWFDAPLVEKCARALPDVRFILSGPVRSRWRLRRLSGLANVVIEPAPPRERVAATIERCTVGIIPFVQNEISFFSDPVQVYEYSALGKPVVSTVDSCSGLSLHVAADADEFVGTLEKVLRAPIDADAIRGAAAGRSWADIAAQMEKILK